MELKEAQNFIDTHHRHHQAAHRDKFRIAAMEDGEIVGVVQVGRPVSCVLDDGNTLEVLRCALMVRRMFAVSCIVGLQE